MNGFLSFVSPDAMNPLQNEEDFDFFTSQVEDIIAAWLRSYVDIYHPDFTFEEAVRGISSTIVTDDTIAFSVCHPNSKYIECFEFGRYILDDIQEQTRRSIERTFFEGTYLKDKIFKISPETIAIIRSWRPDITAESIITVNIQPFDHRNENYEYNNMCDHLEFYYHSEPNRVKFSWIPNVFKGEYISSGNVLSRKVSKERSEIIEGILNTFTKERSEIIDRILQKNYPFG